MSLMRSTRVFRVACGLAFVVWLAGCGGGNDAAPTAATVPGVDITNVTPEQITVAKALKHSAALGVLVGSKVEVRDAFAKSGAVLYSTTTDNNGQFSVELPNYAQYSMFLVTVSGGNDWDVNDTGTRDAAPTPFSGQINALVDPNDLLTGSITVSLLSDAAYRLIGGDLSSFNASSLNVELNRIAGVLLKPRVAGGSSVSNDLLHFDATNPDDRAKLKFDFATLSQPVAAGSDNQTLLDKYHAGAADVTSAWRTVTGSVAGVSPTLAQETNKNTAKLQVTLTGQGRITSRTLPGGLLDPAPTGYAAVVPRDGSTLGFDAVATDAAWKFHSWVGCTTAVGAHCDAAMSGDIAVTARFDLINPVRTAAATSLGRITPLDSVTGVRFNADGSATIITRDAATTTFLQSATVGTFIQTGHMEHPTVKVTGIVSPATSVAASATDATTLPMTTMTFQWEEASPVDVYDTMSVVVDSTPLAFDEVRAITIGDGVGGSVRTVIPAPDFTSSVVAASVLGTPPTWYVTLGTDSANCHGFGADASARAALQAAWQASPRTYPFTAAAVTACISSGQFTVSGDLTDYVMAKSLGESDLLSGRLDGTGKLAMRAPQTRLARADAVNPKLSAGQAIERRGEPVWVSGVGVAIPLGNSLFLAAREDEPSGFRLVALQNTVSITTAQAIKQANSDCSMRGLSSACGLLAGLERERMGLRNVGMIPLLSTPLSLTLSNEKTKLKGEVSLNLNIDLSPRASFDWSIPGIWAKASAGADFKLKPELGLKLAYGASVESFKVPASSKKKKFNKDTSKGKTDSNKINTSKTALTIDLGRAIPYAGAVLDLSLNLVVGVDVGGELSVEIKPALSMAGDFGARAYYEWHCCRSNDKDISAWFHMAPPQPSLTGELKGTIFAEPYAELNLAAGLRKVAPNVAKLYVKGGVIFRGEASTGFTYGVKFRDDKTPDSYAEGPVQKNSSKYWESCSLDTRTKNASSCACAADEFHLETRELFLIGKVQVPVIDKKCVQRGTPVLLPGKAISIPQRCVNSPEFSVGAYAHARAGMATSSDGFHGDLKDWLSFINKDFALLDKEWPIWEYPAKDDEDEADLTGCKDVK